MPATLLGRRFRTVIFLRIDLTLAKVLVWVARTGRDAELLPEAHLYFYDRYRRLARWYGVHGQSNKASRYAEKAEEHFRAAGGDGPPYEAAMAMPRPARWIRTNAIGRIGQAGPPDAA